MRRGGWNSRRVLIDVSSDPQASASAGKTKAVPAAAAATAAAVEQPSEEVAAPTEAYEEQSFIPNKPTPFKNPVTATIVAVSSPIPIAEASESVPNFSVSSSGLAGLLSYSDTSDKEEDEGYIKQAIQTKAQNLGVAICPPAPSSLDLPAGWIVVKDESSGDSYFWHEATNVTSWDPPPRIERQNRTQVKTAHVDERTSAPSISGSAESSASQPPPLADGWTEVVDDASKSTYYWHEATDETTWDRPVNATVANMQQADSLLKLADDVEMLHQVHSATAPNLTMTASAPSTSSSSVSSTSSSLLINALLSGLNLRLRSSLSVILPPLATSMTLEQSISPLMQLIVQLRICEREWDKIQSNTGVVDAAVESKLLLHTLQRITVDIDSELEKEASWRTEQQTRTAPPLDATINASTQFSINTISEASAHAPPPRSGIIHPSRLGAHPVVIGIPAVFHTDNNAKKRDRTEDYASTPVDSGVSKKVKKAASASSISSPSILQTSVGGLVSKWKAVSEAANEEAAAKKKERQLLQQAIDDGWKTSTSNANMIPVGDWRAKIAKQQQQISATLNASNGTHLSSSAEVGD